MVTIRIADHVKTASTYDDGQKIFELISPKIANGEAVSVSFEGFQAVPSAFVNAAFIQLAEIAPIGRIRALLRFEHSTRFINDLIKRRFDFISQRPADVL